MTLSQPLNHSQGLCSLQALSWLEIENSQELSHGCESVVEAVRVFYTLAASLGSPTITMGTLTAFIGTLTASADTFMASTTLTRPLQTLWRLCNSLKASSGSHTGYTSTLTASTALLWPLQTLSCEILPTILQNVYFYCSSSKTFLDSHERVLEAMRVLLEAVIVLLKAVRTFV